MHVHRKRKGRKSPFFKPSSRLDVNAFSLRLLEAIDTPRSLATALLLKYGEHDQLVGLEIDPLNYASPADFFLDYQATKLLSKFPNLKLSSDPLENALKKFIESEKQCMETNDRLSCDSGPAPPYVGSAVGSIMFRAQRKVSHILGDVPDLAELSFQFGPGAAYGVRRETSVFNKLSSVPECTFAMRPILGAFAKEFPAWLGESQEFTFREGSELAFVPKNAKTHRPICIEPLLNGLYQKGFGSFMRNRLLRFGVDLNDQGVNQKLASIAHREELSTIDFSSASDTVSYKLVLDLLPFEWFKALDIARCAFFSYEGKWWPFQKFTSMGNAYTFELETLIFYSIACACCEELGIKYETGVNLSVYGDDVIIPRAAYNLFSEVCSHFGFSINDEKSFRAGPFFESCGKDYFLGCLVRPFLLKKDIVSLEDMYYVTNRVLETVRIVSDLHWPSTSRNDFRGVVDRLHDVHSWCLSCIPKRFRFLVPEGSGDGGLVADFSIAKPTCPRAKRGWEGFTYRSVRRIPRKYDFNGIVPMSLALYFSSIPTSSRAFAMDRLSLFSEVEKERHLARPFRRWQDIPEPLDNGSGFTIRGRTRVRILKQFWFGPWPLSHPWSERSIRLIE